MSQKPPLYLSGVTYRKEEREEIARRISERLLREVFRPRIQLYAVHVNSGQASFVKDFDYYAGQGGFKQSWGKAWTIVAALSFEAVRVYAMKHMGAAADGLFCPRCGEGKHGPCTRDEPAEAVKVHWEVAKDFWERQQKEQGR